MPYRPILLTFLLLTCNRELSFGQTLVKGILTDSTMHPVASATVTYSLPSNKTILGFSISYANGEFLLSIRTQADSIKLHIDHISFEQKSLVVKNISANYNFILSVKHTQLKEAVSNAYSGAIYRKRDTINYNVDSFTSKQDRTIADVIKKLPGVELRGDEIWYQGAKIQNFYVNGLDLMGGRYGIVTNNLPSDAVKDIQIIENDQPIKLLATASPSDKASLNLVLKSKVKTTGSGKIGIGVAPLLWDVGITPMTFTNKFQMINSFQANNTGYSVARQLKSLIPDNDSGARITALLGIESAGSPPFDESKWLDNNAKLLSTNMLFKGNNDMQWTTNLAYINDHQQTKSFSTTAIATTGRTVYTSDDIHNSYNINELQGGIAMKLNTSRIYANDQLSIDGKWNDNTGLDYYDSSGNISQRYQDRNSLLLNKLILLGKIGSRIFGVKSVVSFGHSPQHLYISPGQFPDILNDSVAYNKTIQDLTYYTFYANNSINFTQIAGKAILTLLAGSSFQVVDLPTRLSTNLHDDLGRNFYNDTRLTHNQFYITPTVVLRYLAWRITLANPIQWHHLTPQYYGVKADSTALNKLTYDPSLLVQYRITKAFKLTLANSYSNIYGGVSQLLQSYLLPAFNNITYATTKQISQSSVWNNSLAVEYADPYSSTFANVEVNFSQKHNNTLSNISYDTSGIAYSQLVPLGNNQLWHGISGNGSHYFSAIKTVFKLSGDWNRSTSEVLVDGISSRLASNSTSGTVELNNSSLKFLNIGYKGTFAYTTSSLANEDLTATLLQIHHFEVYLFALKNQTLDVINDYYINKAITLKDQDFLNLKYIYTFPGTKTDLSLTCNNFLNAKYYITQYTSLYSLVYSQLYLRPRQLFLSLRFNFK